MPQILFATLVLVCLCITHDEASITFCPVSRLDQRPQLVRVVCNPAFRLIHVTHYFQLPETVLRVLSVGWESDALVRQGDDSY